MYSQDDSRDIMTRFLAFYMQGSRLYQYRSMRLICRKLQMKDFNVRVILIQIRIFFVDEK